MVVDSVAAPMCRCDCVQTSNNLHLPAIVGAGERGHLGGLRAFVAARTFNATSAAKCSFVYCKEFLDRLNLGDSYLYFVASPTHA